MQAHKPVQLNTSCRAQVMTVDIQLMGKAVWPQTSLGVPVQASSNASSRVGQGLQSFAGEMSTTHHREHALPAGPLNLSAFISLVQAAAKSRFQYASSAAYS